MTLSLHWKINIATVSHLNYLLGNCVGWSEALTSNQYHSFSFYTSRVNKPSHLPATVINVTLCPYVNESSFSQVNTYFHSIFIFTGVMSSVEECCRNAKWEGETFTRGQTAQRQFQGLWSGLNWVIMKSNLMLNSASSWQRWIIKKGTKSIKCMVDMQQHAFSQVHASPNYTINAV